MRTDEWNRKDEAARAESNSLTLGSAASCQREGEAAAYRKMLGTLLHIHLLGVLVAVYIDVDDVLALAEAGAAEGELAGAGGTSLIGAAVDVAQAVGDEGGHSGVVVSVVVDGHLIAAVRLRDVIPEVVVPASVRGVIGQRRRRWRLPPRLFLLGQSGPGLLVLLIERQLFLHLRRAVVHLFRQYGVAVAQRLGLQYRVAVALGIPAVDVLAHLGRVGYQVLDDAVYGEGWYLAEHRVDGRGYRADIPLRVQAEHVAKRVTLRKYNLPHCVGLGLIGAVAA